MTKTVLFLIFNRPKTAQQTFDAIRQAKPPRLYLASDGPRPGEPHDPALIRETQQQVLNMIDWDCRVETLFRHENLGCQKAVSSAISWFFENEEDGIILEDDCLPDQSFFPFCETLLNRYKDHDRVKHISGNNFQGGRWYGEGDYYFSIYNHIWGWATWRKAWDQFSLTIQDPARIEQFMDTHIPCANAHAYWRSLLQKAVQHKITTSWAYFWTLSLWQHDGWSILPNRNLVVNTGFQPNATHTRQSVPGVPATSEALTVPFRDPLSIEISAEADRHTESILFRNHTLLEKIYNKLKTLVRL